MSRLAANISMLYPELPFLQRLGAAARDGFRAVECLFPYAFPAAEMRARLQQHGLQLVLFNAPPAGTTADAVWPAWQAGARGSASIPGREAEFRQGLELALRRAEQLGCPRIHCMAGIPLAGTTALQARRTYLENLRWAARAARGAGCTLLIEPINARDMPGYFLQHQAQAHEIVQELGADNLKVQMDLYHCQVTEGDITTRIRNDLPTGRIGHFQIAGVPDRHEPDEGELNYRYLFQVLDDVAARCGWEGWVGCEYHPRLGTQAGGTTQGLRWRERLGVTDPAQPKKAQAQ